MMLESVLLTGPEDELPAALATNPSAEARSAGVLLTAATPAGPEESRLAVAVAAGCSVAARQALRLQAAHMLGRAAEAAEQQAGPLGPAALASLQPRGP